MSGLTLRGCVCGFRTAQRARRLSAARILSYCAAVILGALPCHPALASSCTLVRLAELPVTMSAAAPTVHAKINGTDATFIADSGAFYSMLTPATAAQFKLSLRMAPMGYWISGVGGDTQPWVTTVKTFTIFNLDIPNMVFLVGGNDLGGAAGLLGQNVLRIADVEYDLANGAIRIMRPENCKSAALAYWAKSTPYSVMAISTTSPTEPHTTGVAYLNGVKIRVVFDSGARSSLLSLGAARRAGITATSDGAVGAGAGGGIGGHYVQTWIAPFQSFKIGDEEVRNTKLRFGDLQFRDTDMLLGADFFLSHHIYVANSQHKLYFTYNGGAVFDLDTTPRAAAADESIAVASGQALDKGAEPVDAAGFSRRGTALAARHDYASAIADLTRACELAPTEASYRYQRGLALWGNQQPDPALADFDAAIKLRPDDVPSLLARARLRVLRSDFAGATADLDVADRSAAKEAAERMEMGDLYGRAQQLPAAIAQYSMWIDSHERIDVRMPQALNSRCWSRALLGQELDKALSDCNAALRLKSGEASFLDSRGLVYLRQGHYDKAIADYDTALAAQPRMAWSLYDRGIARLRKGQATEGHADVAAAIALAPTISEEASRYGIKP